MVPQIASQGGSPRLQKVLAAAGLGSRRQCEDLILEGRVEVDQQVVTELGTRVDPESQSIRVDGVPLKLPRRVYFAVNKPKGVVSTARDQWRRTRVVDLVASDERLFTIGRLDKESSGLILVTNDGELANRLTHPRYGVSKTYHVTVAGVPSMDVVRQLRRGFFLAEGPVRPGSVAVKKRLKRSTILEIVLSEGRNREIRRMLARVQHKVLRLHRVAIGPIRLGDLPVGASRELRREEVRELQRLNVGSGKAMPDDEQSQRKTKGTRASRRGHREKRGEARAGRPSGSGRPPKAGPGGRGRGPSKTGTRRRRPPRSGPPRKGSAGV